MGTKTISTLLVLSIIFSSVIVFNANLASAQNKLKISSPSPPQAVITDNVIENAKDNQRVVNSYELFWPLVAGRTEGDSLYFLKLLKERIQGWFIGRDSKKADYEILLGTKRMLEAEMLIKDSKIDSALRTLEKADFYFSKAYNDIKTADSKGKLITKDIGRERLINLKILTDYLKTVAPKDAYPGLDAVREKVDRILGDYLP